MFGSGQKERNTDNKRVCIKTEGHSSVKIVRVGSNQTFPSTCCSVHPLAQDGWGGGRGGERKWNDVKINF